MQLDERLAVRWWWWSLPTLIRLLSVPTPHKRQEGERKRKQKQKTSALFLPTHLLCLMLCLSPLHFQSNTWAAPVFSPCLSPLREKGERMHRRENTGCLFIITIKIIRQMQQTIKKIYVMGSKLNKSASNFIFNIRKRELKC